MDLESAWERVLVRLQDADIRPEDVDIWLRDAHPVRLEDQQLTVQVANRFYVDWITDNLGRALRDAARLVLGPRVEIALISGDDPVGEWPITEPLAAESAEPRGSTLNPAQTFQSFVVGECNRFAHAAAEGVATVPARRYNPLFLYGHTGLGKTHLMHAIGHEILRRDTNATVVYVTAEDFMNEMINSIRFKRTDEFRQKYRQRASVLLVDDIQFLSGKDRTQEEFFFTFNALQAAGRQIVLTSDVVPADIKGLEDRLRTRFEGGLIADVQPPDHETMIAILQAKAELAGFRMPSDLAAAVASAAKGSIRELEGVVHRLVALRLVYHEPITLDFARRHIPRLLVPTTSGITVPAIIEVVARFHNLRAADITGKKRTRALTGPRHLAMYLARNHTQLSFPELGREFGGRDHSTIQHGCKKVEEELVENPELSYQIGLIEQQLQLRQRRMPEA